jgi:hypothetical protein
VEEYVKKNILMAVCLAISLTVLAAVAGMQGSVIKLLSGSKGVLLQATAPTVQSLIDAGKDFLNTHNVVAARNSFKQAVELDAAHQEAQFWYGVTRILALYEDNQYVQTDALDSVREILERSGVSFSSFGLFDTQGQRVSKTLPTSTPRTGDVISYVSTKVLPEINGAIANFDAVTTTTFVSILDPTAVLHTYSQPITIDFGDVLVIKALSSLALCNFELLKVYGLDFSPPQLFNGDTKQLKRYHDLLLTSPQLLTPINPASLTTAKGGLVNFIDTFKTAATTIQKRQQPSGHAFVLDIPLNDSPVGGTTYQLNKILSAMNEVKASLSAPTYYSFTKNTFLDLSKFFNSAAPINIRQQVINSTTGAVFSDATIDGLLPLGLSSLQTAMLVNADMIRSVAYAGAEKAHLLTEPSSLRFYDNGALGSYRTATITLSNNGTADLTLSSMTVKGAYPTDFSIAPGSCSTLTPTLVPGAACTVTAHYTPTTNTSSSSAFIDIASNVDAVTIPLQGTLYSQNSLPPTPSATKLIVSRNGNGAGRIEQPYLSIGCTAATCTYTTNPGGFITIRAVPGRYSMLTKWTGCESVSDDTCSINPAKDNNVTATFELITTPFSLTAYPTPGTYTAPQKVALVGNNNVPIRYTIDGSIPTTASPVYTSPLSVGLGTTTVNYLYFNNNGIIQQNSAQYIITNPNATAPPLISSFKAATTPGSFEVKILDLAVTDSSSITNYCVSQYPDAFNCTWRSSLPSEYFFMSAAGFGTYQLYAYVKDQFGVLSQRQVTDVTFIPDTTAPALVNVTPAVGATSVPVDTKLTLSFDELVWPNDVTGHGIGKSGCAFDGQPDMPCTVDFDTRAKAITIKFVMPLEYSKTYSAIWDFADHSGNKKSVSVNFTTAPKPAYSTVPNISLALSTNGLISGSGKPLLASGVMTAGTASVANQNISLLITKPDNTITIHSVTTDEKGLYADVPLTSYLNQLGNYKVQAFGGSGSGSTAPNKSTIATVRLLPVAGYALIVQGRIPSGEGQEAHAKTVARVRNALVARGLDPNDITTIVATDINSGKADIVRALSTIAGKMNARPAPFQMILIDHGEENKFHLGDDSNVLTPSELAGWLDTTENSLSGTAQNQPRTIIIGSCYSGSFITALAKAGRTIITSASATEQSFRGPAEPDGVRSGELFLDELYRGLKKGSSLKDAFNTAVESVRTQSRRGGIVSSRGDKALQNPLVSFGGNPVGVSEIPTGVADDAPDSAYLGTGDNFAYNPQAMLPQDRIASVQSLFLDENTRSATISTKGAATNVAWFEVRAPSLPLVKDGGSSQLIANLPRVDMTFDQATQTFSGIYNGFNDAGSYDITIYQQDIQSGDITPKHITLYRNRAKNNVPQTPELVEPALAATVTSAVLAQWAEAQDPDGDVITYTLLMSKQQDMSNPVLVKEGLTLPVEAILYEDGLRDLTTYFWQVWAIDSYGATTKSIVGSFTTNNTNGLPSYIKGYVTNTTSTSPVSGATLTTGETSRKSYNNGGFLFAATPGSYNLVVSADGFQSKTVALIAVPGRVSTQNINVTPSASEKLALTSSVVSAAGSGYLDCPATATAGETITCRLQAGAGYQFSGIEGCGGALSGSSYSAIIMNSCAITAHFTPVISVGTVSYTITAKASAGGSLVCIPATVTEGATSTCITHAMTGFKLVSITDNSLNVQPLPSGQNFTISGIASDHSVSAVYIAAKPGDCNNDGQVTIAEVQSAINMFLGLKTVAACVDTSGDTTVSIAEVQKTINSFLGL